MPDTMARLRLPAILRGSVLPSLPDFAAVGHYAFRERNDVLHGVHIDWSTDGEVMLVSYLVFPLPMQPDAALLGWSVRLRAPGQFHDRWARPQVAMELPDASAALGEALRAEAVPFWEECADLAGFVAYAKRSRWGNLHSLEAAAYTLVWLNDLPAAAATLDELMGRESPDFQAEWYSNLFTRSRGMLGLLQNDPSGVEARELLARYVEANRVRAFGAGRGN